MRTLRVLCFTELEVSLLVTTGSVSLVKGGREHLSPMLKMLGTNYPIGFIFVTFNSG